MNPGVSIDLHGHLAKPYGPGISLLHLEVAGNKRRTVLRVSDATIGIAGDPSSKKKGWQQVFAEGLKQYVETGQ
jgi:hypothetical protein